MERWLISCLPANSRRKNWTSTSRWIDLSARFAYSLVQNGRWVRKQDPDGATCHSRQFSVGATGKSYWNLGAYHNTRRHRSGQVFKLLEEDISGFQIGDDQKIHVSCDRRLDLLDTRCIARNGTIECERTIDYGSGNLPAIDHLAKGGGIARRWYGSAN